MNNVNENLLARRTILVLMLPIWLLHNVIVMWVKTMGKAAWLTVKFTVKLLAQAILPMWVVPWKLSYQEGRDVFRSFAKRW